MKLRKISQNLHFILFSTLCSILLGVLLVPDFIVLLLGGLLLVTILLEFLKFILWRAPRNMARQLPNKATPLVSIHLAIYNEPAPMVITTIKHILNQDYPIMNLLL